MKYLKGFIVLLLLAWAVSVPIATDARPGSILNRLQVVVNDPIWEWIHITAEGRGKTIEQQMNKRYADIERAWASQEQWQMDWALKAEAMTFSRAQSLLRSTASEANYKVADTLASHGGAIVRAHRQVMFAMQTKPEYAKSAASLEFMNERYATLEDARVDIENAFAKAFDREILVRGIDDKLTAVDLDIAKTQDLLSQKESALSERQRLAIQNTISYARSLQAGARNKVGLDQYVDAYRQANDAQGYTAEAIIVLRAIDMYGLDVVPTTPDPTK